MVIYSIALVISNTDLASDDTDTLIPHIRMINCAIVMVDCTVETELSHKNGQLCQNKGSVLPRLTILCTIATVTSQSNKNFEKRV